MGHAVAARSGFIDRWLAGRTPEEKALADEELRLLMNWLVVDLAGRWDLIGNELPADFLHLDSGKATPEQVRSWREIDVPAARRSRVP